MLTICQNMKSYYVAIEYFLVLKIVKMFMVINLYECMSLPGYEHRPLCTSQNVSQMSRPLHLSVTEVFHHGC